MRGAEKQLSLWTTLCMSDDDADSKSDDAVDGISGNGVATGMAMDVVVDVVVDLSVCPVCDERLRCERRGGEWFAWCANGNWGQGCSGMNSFGADPDESRHRVWEAFHSI